MRQLNDDVLQQMYISSLLVIASHHEDKKDQQLSKLKRDATLLLLSQKNRLKVSQQYMLEFSRDVLSCLSKQSEFNVIRANLEHVDIVTTCPLEDEQKPALVDDEIDFINKQFD
ncbi:hypothetical protein [uncultured Shewanella sp.]|uniref:hypothetical protein n=1 Tax=uncultured Shewanella sp. TaxID=173975 RepID=UPI003704C992